MEDSPNPAGEAIVCFLGLVSGAYRRKRHRELIQIKRHPVPCWCIAR